MSSSLLQSSRCYQDPFFSFLLKEILSLSSVHGCLARHCFPVSLIDLILIKEMGEKVMCARRRRQNWDRHIGPEMDVPCWEWQITHSSPETSYLCTIIWAQNKLLSCLSHCILGLYCRSLAYALLIQPSEEHSTNLEKNKAVSR